jgi:hypothetical protein
MGKELTHGLKVSLLETNMLVNGKMILKMEKELTHQQTETNMLVNIRMVKKMDKELLHG